jgi:hypothetical protein
MGFGVFEDDGPGIGYHMILEGRFEKITQKLSCEFDSFFAEMVPIFFFSVFEEGID